MKREHFVKVVEEALDSLPQEFRSRIRNVAVLVEDLPPNQLSPQSGQQKRLLLGVFHGVPATKKSIFDLPTGTGCASAIAQTTSITLRKTACLSVQRNILCLFRIPRSTRFGLIRSRRWLESFGVVVSSSVPPPIAPLK